MTNEQLSSAIAVYINTTGKVNDCKRDGCY